MNSCERKCPFCTSSCGNPYCPYSGVADEPEEKVESVKKELKEE